MLVRPSLNNMHEFVAEEDSCFFDVCLPNYQVVGNRRITYFRDVKDVETITENRSKCLIEYDTTPPVMPVNFKVGEVDFIGKFE